MTPDTAVTLLCPHCGAALKPTSVQGQKLCWLCRGPLDDKPLAGGEAPVLAELVPENAAVRPAQFTLSGMLLVVTFAAVLLGVWVESPGAGILLTLVAVPALLATAVRSMRRRSRGEPLSWGQQAATFLVAAAAVWGLLLALVFAAFVAFFIYCLIDRPHF